MLCLSGCGNLKDIKDIKVTSVNVESISPRGFKSVDVFLSAGVENPAKQVSVSEINGSIEYSGKIIGVLAMDPFVLAAKSTEVYNLKANIGLAKGAGYKDLMVLVNPDALNSCTVDISAKATYGKNTVVPIKIKDVPLNKLLKSISHATN